MAHPTHRRHFPWISVKIVPRRFRILCVSISTLAIGLSMCLLFLLPSPASYVSCITCHLLSPLRISYSRNGYGGRRDYPVFRCPGTSHGSPSLLLHKRTDEELFELVAQKEIQAGRNASSSSTICLKRRFIFADDDDHRRPWKIAFLFLTRGPLPFAEIWESFFHGAHQGLFNIYVHLDAFDPSDFEIRTAANVFCGRVIPSYPTERGAPSLAAAERRLLANALLHDPGNLYFALLSDHCIPLRSFRHVYDYLVRKADGKSFIEILSNEPTLVGRYESRGGPSTMLPEVPFDRFRVGSQFFVLNRDHAASVVEDKKIWRKFDGPCRDMEACYTEEHYFSTYMDMEVHDAGECVQRRTLTYVEWTFPNDGHPRTFREEEIGEDLIERLRHDGQYLFARKFADDSDRRLLQLSAFLFADYSHYDEAPSPIPTPP